MTIREVLASASRSLKGAMVETPRLDAEILLAHLLKKDAAYLLMHPEVKINPAIKRRFFALVKRRAEREPVAYIVGRKEFYGLDFLVNRHTLIPRPETETLVEVVLKNAPAVIPSAVEGSRRQRDCSQSFPEFEMTIVDIGTGSGAIAVTLAKLLPHATVYATDTSAAALRVARKNSKRHSVRVHFKKGNLIDPIMSIFTFATAVAKVKTSILERTKKNNIQIMIIANLPYLPTKTWRAAQLEIKRHEPRAALDGGPDGLKYYRQLISQIKKLLITSQRVSKVDKPWLEHFRARQGGNERSEITNYLLLITLYLEIDPRQAKPLTALIYKTFPRAHVQIKKDLAGRDRVFIATLPSVEHLSPRSRSCQH